MSREQARGMEKRAAILAELARRHDAFESTLTGPALAKRLSIKYPLLMSHVAQLRIRGFVHVDSLTITLAGYKHHSET